MRSRSPITFQAKVLIPVISIMVLLIVVPMWVVNQRMSRQLEISAAERLTTADAVFKRLGSLRAKNLLARYGNAGTDPRLKAVLQKADAKTIAVLLQDLLDEKEGSIVSFANNQLEQIAYFSRDPRFDVAEFRDRSAANLRQSLQGDGQVEMVCLSGRLHEILSIPVTAGDSILGALTFGIEMGKSVVEEFKGITRSEIVLLADRGIAAATLSAADLPSGISEAFERPGQAGLSPKPRRQRLADSVLVNGEHFMFIARELNGNAEGPKLEYILLSSYEKPLRALQATQQTFLWIQFGGILLGGVLVWLLVRRVTSPLRQLRDTAEAVGQGDFSRRVEIRSRDECGELAGVFNRMTRNLKSSREELERTLETLKSTQAQLVQSEKLRAIGTLAGGIAHDFNNILGAILGFGELVLDDVPAGSRAARNMHQVVKAGQRAKDLVRQILAFSRQDQPRRVHVRLSSMIDETLKLLRATLPTTVAIETRILTQADTVVADPSQLHQVLMNLGTNASHAMREKGGSLTVTLEEIQLPSGNEGEDGEGPDLPVGNYLRLGVADTGHGMSPEVIERIFEPFFTTKPVGEGTGLGLSVVHGIVKSHGGEITVTSQPGQGTTFFIFLPLARGLEAPDASGTEPLPGKSECILVVDDEEPLVNLMQQKLARLGYEVVAHRDSLEALREFRATPGRFDVVITDQTMPHLKGNDLARRLVEIRPDTPIILCSGSGNALLDAGELSPAVRQFVPKPVNFIELSRSIRQVLGDAPGAEVTILKEALEYETSPSH